MQEQRVMTKNEMAMAKATGARVVSMSEQDAEEALAIRGIIGLRDKMNALVPPLNTSHDLPLGWTVEGDLQVVKQLLDLKREQLIQLEEAHYNLRREIRDLGFDPKKLG